LVCVDGDADVGYALLLINRCAAALPAREQQRRSGDDQKDGRPEVMARHDAHDGACHSGKSQDSGAYDENPAIDVCRLPSRMVLG
jgi:hypothetical protein